MDAVIAIAPEQSAVPATPADDIAPASPQTTSVPPRAQITSGPLVPCNSSSLLVPVIVHSGGWDATVPDAVAVATSSHATTTLIAAIRRDDRMRMARLLSE